MAVVVLGALVPSRGLGSPVGKREKKKSNREIVKTPLP